MSLSPRVYLRVMSLSPKVNPRVLFPVLPKVNPVCYSLFSLGLP